MAKFELPNTKKFNLLAFTQYREIGVSPFLYQALQLYHFKLFTITSNKVVVDLFYCNPQ